MSRFLTFITILVFVILALTVIIYGANTDWDYQQMRQEIADFGIWAPMVFILIYSVAATFLPVSPFIIMSGLMFGPVWGTAYALFGGLLGATVAFTTARILGKPFVDRKLKSRRYAVLAHYNNRLEGDGLYTVMFLRLIPLIPLNGLSLAMGVTKVSTFNYALGTLIGIVPSTVVLAYFGGSIYSWPLQKIIIVALVVLALLILPPIYHRKYRKLQAESENQVQSSFP